MSFAPLILQPLNQNAHALTTQCTASGKHKRKSHNMTSYNCKSIFLYYIYIICLLNMILVHTSTLLPMEETSLSETFISSPSFIKQEQPFQRLPHSSTVASPLNPSSAHRNSQLPKAHSTSPHRFPISGIYKDLLQSHALQQFPNGPIEHLRRSRCYLNRHSRTLIP